MKIEERDGGTVVTLTEDERTALYAVVAHTVPMQIVELADDSLEPVNHCQVQSVVLALYAGLKRR
jgi:hypothetical protein